MLDFSTYGSIWVGSSSFKGRSDWSGQHGGRLVKVLQLRSNDLTINHCCPHCTNRLGLIVLCESDRLSASCIYDHPFVIDLDRSLNFWIDWDPFHRLAGWSKGHCIYDNSLLRLIPIDINFIAWIDRNRSKIHPNHPTKFQICAFSWEFSVQIHFYGYFMLDYIVIHVYTYI